jgi:hypothetical protein
LGVPGIAIGQATSQEAGKMQVVKCCARPLFIGLALLVLAATAAPAAVDWPAALYYTVGVSTDEASRIQSSATFTGPLSEDFGLTLAGWWITGGSNNRAFVGDAFIDYDRDPVYLAAGRKFVPFGPVGMLVSPGIWGGEVKLTHDRVTVQAISGTIAFTPVTGGTRFTYAGNRGPSEESLTAARLAVALTDPSSPVPVTVGLNWIDVLDDSGTSVDVAIEANDWLGLFGEFADYNDAEARAYGIRLSDQKLRPDTVRHTILVFYHRSVPIGFVPAQIGASQFYEEQSGWVGGIYHQLNERYGVGVYADNEDAVLTLFGYLPL